VTTVARDRLLAAALVAALIAHAIVTKLPDDLLDEMLYSCHVASLILAIGLVGRWRWLIAAGFLFHLGVGWVAWTLDVLDTQTTTPTSALVHFLPLLSGFLVFRDESLPRGATAAAIAIYVALQPISYWLTEPAHNINLAHAPWPPLEPYFPSMGIHRVVMAAIALAFLFTAELVFHRLKRATVVGSAPAGGGNGRI
jgi:hypothetical protein